MVATKDSDPVDGSEVEPGQTITYTLTFTNRGTGTGEVSYVDDLGDVLDDAEFVEVTSVGDGLEVEDPTDSALTVTGTLEAGATSTVSYTVRVLPYEEQGDHVLTNHVTLTGIEPPSECDEDDPTCTSHPSTIPPEPAPERPDLPRTGLDLAVPVLGALLLIGAGTVLYLSSRRRRLGNR
ncbi:hypothetical protein [Glycomyces tenuis]|uniref:DUF7927 domain-containing protein n=1 Tax=Glycomyces tenuis TaxID=58116 RepID=UPI003CCC0F49